MRTLSSIAELRTTLDTARREDRRVGLVPTMGYLHAGHTSLVERAAIECDEVVTTIFVNPLQFAPDEDLDAYPRDPDGDARKAADAGATLLFTPSLHEMYPAGRGHVMAEVSVAGLSGVMEGVSRRTHFAGVCTVVAKLFNIVGPCRAYFGEKDFQQLAIVRRMVDDLSYPVEVSGCPIVREADGLAMSSRNAYLTDEERLAAPVLQRALRLGAAAIRSGTSNAHEVRTLMRAEIEASPIGTVDYVEVVDPRTLQPQDVAGRSSRLFGAVQFGRARLIDNLAVDDPALGSDADELTRLLS